MLGREPREVSWVGSEGKPGNVLRGETGVELRGDSLRGGGDGAVSLGWTQHARVRGWMRRRQMRRSGGQQIGGDAYGFSVLDYGLSICIIPDEVCGRGVKQHIA